MSSQCQLIGRTVYLFPGFGWLKFEYPSNRMCKYPGSWVVVSDQIPFHYPDTTPFWVTFERERYLYRVYAVRPSCPVYYFASNIGNPIIITETFTAESNSPLYLLVFKSGLYFACENSRFTEDRVSEACRRPVVNFSTGNKRTRE